MSQLTRITTGIRSNLLLKEYTYWLRKNDRVLDVGCGDGIMSSILAEKIGIKVSGCDIENYLQIDMPFSIMKSSDKLPFKKSSFDAVMFNDVLHHMSFENQIKIIQESLRVAPKVLIFEVEPTFIGASADFIINKFHNITMHIPLTFRSHAKWIIEFKKLHVKYHYRKPEKPLLYPFTHQAFLLQK